MNKGHITIVADYGGGYQRSDFAFIEVKQEMLHYFGESRIDHVSVPAFDTLGTGFLVAQLALRQKSENGKKAENRIIYHNTAPREDDLGKRLTNKGEGLAYCQLKNGVHVIGVNAGYTFSFLKPYVDQIWQVDIGDTKSQFRSRDNFPQKAFHVIAKKDKSFLTEEIRQHIPDMYTGEIQTAPNGQKAIDGNRVYIDGYGNIKLDIAERHFHEAFFQGQSVEIQIGDIVRPAIISYEGMFSVPRNDNQSPLVLSQGSSGWDLGDSSLSFMQISQRYGSAAAHFPGIEKRENQKVKITSIA